MGSLINYITFAVLIFNVGAYPKQNIPNADLTLRIVGGHVAKDGEFPYVAGLVLTNNKGGKSVCGGSLISSTSVLTAAHCLHGEASAKVILGARNISDHSTEKKRQAIISDNFISHPNYNDDTLLNDIAIIKLPYPAILDDHHVKLIPIPADDKETYAGETSIFMGWGQTSDATGKSSNTIMRNLVLLHYETNIILTNTKCKTFHSSYESAVKDTNICQSGAGRKSACDGDSGGPLVVDGVQVGILSQGPRKCESGHPSVYTRLSKYIDWIKSYQ